MLGIAHHKHLTIDLWLGDPKDFVCDRLLGEKELLTRFQALPCTPFPIRWERDQAFDQQLLNLPPTDHLGILGEGAIAVHPAKDLLETLRDHAGSLGHLRRISFIFASLEAYDPFQSQLSETFPWS